MGEVKRINVDVPMELWHRMYAVLDKERYEAVRSFAKVALLAEIEKRERALAERKNEGSPGPSTPGPTRLPPGRRPKL